MKKNGKNEELQSRREFFTVGVDTYFDLQH